MIDLAKKGALRYATIKEIDYFFEIIFCFRSLIALKLNYKRPSNKMVKTQQFT